MAYKNIVAVLTGAKSDRPTLETALAVARPFNAHIEALHARGDPRDAIPVIGEGMSGPLVEEIMQIAERDAKGRESRARETFDAWRKERNLPIAETPPGPGTVSCAWREETGRDDEVVPRRGRASDVIVIARPASAKDLAGETTVEAVLFDTGRNVLIAPPEVRPTVGEHIAVFWNGSIQVARAVGAAMTLLRQAKKVSILTADENQQLEAMSNAGLVAHLAWHGVAATVQRFKPTPRSTGAGLLQQAAQANADLLVMGAFTQSRLRQMILGGVTRHVLAEAQLPVLMAH